MEQIKNVLDKVLSAACVALFGALVLDVVWQVFARQVLNNPSAWSEELARYIFVWLGFFAATLVFSERGHIAVDFVVRKLPLLGQKIVGMLVQLLIIAFSVIGLIWGGWRASQGAWNQNLTALPTQIGPMYLVMPITGVLITLYSVYYLVAIARGTETAVEAIDDAEAI